MAVLASAPIGESSYNEMLVEEEASQCAVCFDDVDKAMSQCLPCACNVVYCALCWDRSLAQSFNSTGEARCPTCRLPVCVDFNPDKNCLVFSRAVVQPPPDQECIRSRNTARQRLECSRQEAVQKLRQQAAPAQMRLLISHGNKNPDLSHLAHTALDQIRRMTVSELRGHIESVGGSIADCIDKEDLVNLLMEEVKTKQMMGRVMGEKFAESSSESPACVCGSSLVRITGAERTMRCCDKMPHLHGLSRESLHYRMAFERLSATQSSVCFCDLCGDSVPTQNAVWTCKNGDSTILHATSYDVCDECFMRYAACGGKLPSPQEATPSTQPDSAGEEPSPMDVDDFSGDDEDIPAAGAEELDTR